jgi:hypothetical protein
MTVKPARRSALILPDCHMGGPDMAPHAPQRSARSGKAGSGLGIACDGVPGCP